MADPKNFLPRSISQTAIHSLLRSLSIPIPTSITFLSTSAAYHTIYTLSYPKSTLSEFLPTPPAPNTSTTTLILRVSGTHFPSIKTLNECTILKWLSAQTQIPVPQVLHYDATRDNPIGYEFILMTMAVGRSFDLVKPELSASLSWRSYQEHLDSFVAQVVDIISELQSHRWHQIGGLRELQGGHGGDGTVIVVDGGPLVDENMWQVPELDLFWRSGNCNGDGENVTFESLNATGPFRSYVSFLIAQAEKYIFAIRRHEKLSSMRSLVPRILGFMAAMEDRQEELNKTRLVLAHRDFHLGNIMYDVDTRRITAVLDWEFAAVVPAQRWDPHRAFLWNGIGSDDEVTRELRERVVKGCKERGVTIFEDVEYTSNRQEHMQLGMNFLRAIVEVLPRDQVEKPVEAWKESMLVHVEAMSSD
ncbi:unnamed protein product [Calypogeia fissa]